MWNWLTNAITSATASIVFFGIFIFGVVFSGITTIFGGHGDSDHDIGHDSDHDSGQGHDGDGSGSFFSVGMVSVRGLALFATAFGGIGFITQQKTGKPLFSSLVGLISGWVFAFLVLLLFKQFKAQQANSLIDLNKALGAKGVITLSIPERGIGEMRVIVSGQEMYKQVRTSDGSSILCGTSVRVEEVEGGTFVVAPLADFSHN